MITVQHIAVFNVKKTDGIYPTLQESGYRVIHTEIS